MASLTIVFRTIWKLHTISNRQENIGICKFLFNLTFDFTSLCSNFKSFVIWQKLINSSFFKKLLEKRVHSGNWVKSMFKIRASCIFHNDGCFIWLLWLLHHGSFPWTSEVLCALFYFNRKNIAHNPIVREFSRFQTVWCLIDDVIFFFLLKKWSEQVCFTCFISFYIAALVMYKWHDQHKRFKAIIRY